MAEATAPPVLDETPPFLPNRNADIFFVLVSGYLVFFMQCGFAMLSVGSVRSKNAKNIILKNLLDACFGAICFYLLGYGFAYGGQLGSGNNFIGWRGFALEGYPIEEFYSWFFQFAFAATAATIVSGAVAERCKFEGYLAYAIVLTSWVYPVVAHWVWDPTGWASASVDRPAEQLLFGTGVVDFAGCGVVHMTGGLAAGAAAAVVGPRLGRYDRDGNPVTMPGHDASLAILGVFILWFGWYGFNPGSALGITEDSDVVAALCAVTTTLSAAGGTVSTLLVLLIKEYVSTGHVLYDLLGASNGTLAGLVGITSATSVVRPWAAIIIGMLSGCVYVLASWLMSDVLKIDDPLDATAVHGFCGAWGLIMAAAFADNTHLARAYGDTVATMAKGGFFMRPGGGRLLAGAICLILAITAWVLGHMVPFFLAMKYLGLLRVEEEEERLGLDHSHHGGSAYEAPAARELVERVQTLEKAVQGRT